MKTRFVSMILVGALAAASCAPAATPAAAPTDVIEPTVVEPTAVIEPTLATTEAPTEAPAVVAPTSNLREGCVEQYAEGVDYFPEKFTVS